MKNITIKLVITEETLEKLMKDYDNYTPEGYKKFVQEVSSSRDSIDHATRQSLEGHLWAIMECI